MISYTYATACQAADSGMSVVPIRADGSKQPMLTGWREYQQRRATFAELDTWFHRGSAMPGLAFVTGEVSGRLEALDFDCVATFDAWQQRVLHDWSLAALWEHLCRGYLEATPAGGRHVLYRCDQVEGNQKLASRVEGETRKTLIETRGEGGLIIVAPSRGKVHPSGKSYLLLQGGVASIRTITTHQRTLLFSALREFDEAPAPPVSAPKPPSLTEGTRPGDLFNQRVSWREILEPHGWQLMHTKGEESYWQRPGKEGRGLSATTNYGGHDLLYVFSTSTCFEPERGYTRFSAYTLLNHRGDFSAAARALAEQGYTTWKRS